METTRLSLRLTGYDGECGVNAVRDDRTPKGLWVHRSHQDSTEWKISHASGYLVTGDFIRRIDALNFAAMLGNADWTNLAIVPGPSTPEITSNITRHNKALQLAVLKFPRSTPRRGGRKWRVAI